MCSNQIGRLACVFIGEQVQVDRHAGWLPAVGLFYVDFPLWVSKIQQSTCGCYGSVVPRDTHGVLLRRRDREDQVSSMRIRGSQGK